MDKASTNGYLTKEQFQHLSAYDIDLEGLGKVKFRKIGSAEFEALWPVPPEAADDWPKVRGEGEVLAATRRERRQAEAAWLRTLPIVDQIRWRTSANDVMFRVIAACAKQPVFSVEDARGLGDMAEILYAAILQKSGLLPTEVPKAPPAVTETVEASADAA